MMIPDKANIYVFTSRRAQGNLATIHTHYTSHTCKPTEQATIESTHVDPIELSLTATRVSILKSDKEGQYFINWQQAGKSIQRCGHGTLAAAYFLLRKQRAKRLRVSFVAPDGYLIDAFVKEGWASINLQSAEVKKANAYWLSSFKYPCVTDVAVSRGANGYMLIRVKHIAHLKEFALNQKQIDRLGCRGLIITTNRGIVGADIGFRYFAPGYSVDEDSATGSAIPVLMAYWQREYSRCRSLKFFQYSKAGGYLVGQTYGLNVRVSGGVR